MAPLGLVKVIVPMRQPPAAAGRGFCRRPVVVVAGIKSQSEPQASAAANRVRFLTVYSKSWLASRICTMSTSHPPPTPPILLGESVQAPEGTLGIVYLPSASVITEVKTVESSALSSDTVTPAAGPPNLPALVTVPER